MNYNQKINMSFIAAIVVYIVWLIGDILIVGFKPNPGDYPLFSLDYADRVHVPLAVHMLAGSTERLMWGALLGALSAPLLFASIWLVYQTFVDKEKWHSRITYYTLLSGVILSPLAHTSFFYIGEIYKSILHTDKISHPYLLQTADGFVRMYHISWGSAVGVLAMGWLLVAILIFMKKTLLPRWTGFFVPVFIALCYFPIVDILPEPASTLLSGAGFSIAQLTFFILLYVLSRGKLNLQQTILS